MSPSTNGLLLAPSYEGLQEGPGATAEIQDVLAGAHLGQACDAVVERAPKPEHFEGEVVEGVSTW